MDLNRRNYTFQRGKRNQWLRFGPWVQITKNQGLFSKMDYEGAWDDLDHWIRDGRLRLIEREKERGELARIGARWGICRRHRLIVHQSYLTKCLGAVI